MPSTATETVRPTAISLANMPVAREIVNVTVRADYLAVARELEE